MEYIIPRSTRWTTTDHSLGNTNVFVNLKSSVNNCAIITGKVSVMVQHHISRNIGRNILMRRALLLFRLLEVGGQCTSRLDHWSHAPIDHPIGLQTSMPKICPWLYRRWDVHLQTNTFPRASSLRFRDTNAKITDSFAFVIEKGLYRKSDSSLTF